jgi:hypothetical protein
MKRGDSGLKKVFVFTGNYGSGKTELALNFAFAAAKAGRTELIDMDLINPYFRISERKKAIEAAGIRLVAPNYVLTNVETMSLPPDVMSAFHMDWDTVIFDAGGDPTGATALGRFKREFDALEDGQLDVYNVINIRRPMSATADKIIGLMREIEQNSHLAVTGLVNNTNLGAETGSQELRDGFDVIREVSEKTGVPVKFTCGKKEFLDIFLKEGHDAKFIGEPVEIDTFTHRDWDIYVGHGI